MNIGNEQLLLKNYILNKSKTSASSNELMDVSREIQNFTNDAEFNMRHDWNSLICDNPKIRLKKFTTKYYPHADDFVKYLNYFTFTNFRKKKGNIIYSKNQDEK